MSLPESRFHPGWEGGGRGHERGQGDQLSSWEMTGALQRERGGWWMEQVLF